MRNRSLSRLAIFGLAFAAGALAQAEQTLQIGDPAPPLKTARWLKGTPVPKFEKGKVYVLEFWATWCGPCKMAMPHLTQLAKKFGDKVTFIGVDIWEDQHAEPGVSLDAKVDQFMQKDGDLMGYNVCASSEDGFMTKNWMAPANQNGIPATFVIDKDSKIAWVGHPSYLEEPLSKIVDGTFDAKGYAAEFEKRRKELVAFEKRYAELMAPLQVALAAKDADRIVAESDRAVAKDPTLALAVGVLEFDALMKQSPDRAYAEAVKIAGVKEQAYGAINIFASKKGLDPKFYRYVIDVITEQFKQYPDLKGGRLAFMASSYASLGEPAKALEWFSKYRDSVAAAGAGEVIMRDIDKEFQRYKDAAAKGS